MADEPQSPPSFTPRRRWTVGFDMVVRTVVVFAVVLMANFLAGKFFRRDYLSRQTSTELSPRTLSLVQSVTNDVKVTLYYDRTEDMFSTVAALLREYQALNPRIRVEVVDYLRDAADAHRVKLAYDLPETKKEEDKNFIIFDAGNGRHKVVNANLLMDVKVEVDEAKGTYNKRPVAFKGEMLFTSLLLAVTSPKPLKAYVLTGHGEHRIEDGDEVTGYLDFKSVLEQNYIKVESLSLAGAAAIPADCNLLVVPGSVSALAPDELAILSRYLDEGGRLFALFNVASVAGTGLEGVLSNRWNVLVSPEVVQDPQHSLNTLRSVPGADVAVGAFSEHPVVKPLIGYNLDLIRPRVVLPIKPDENSADAPKVTILFATENSATLMKNPQVKPRSYPLAVAVERPAVTGVATGRGGARMVVVGDSLFLANGPIKVAANRDFAGYAVNWLVERPQFLEGVGPRPVEEYRIALTVSQMTTIRWLLLGALPGGILLFGGLVWLRRLK